jgi:hypothetical protein
VLSYEDRTMVRTDLTLRDGIAGQQRTLMLSIAIALPVTILFWLAVYFGLSPIPGMETAAARLVFAIKCICLAVLFCFALGIEAVAHERLHSAAINPLTGVESRRMKINLRYLQQTLEQLLVFIPGLLGLAFYCSSGESMRAVAATTATWILARAVFWIGYHKGPQFRAAGLTGMIQSLLVLLYVCSRIGSEIAGIAGAVGVVVLFVGLDGFIFAATRKPEAPTT